MKKIIWIIVIVVIVGLLVWSRRGGETDKPANSIEPVKLGVIISQTGVASAFGEMSKFGIEMAVKEINEASGMATPMVEVVYEDDRTDPKAATGLYQKLTSIDKVDAIIGSNFDFVTQPIFALAETTGTVVISPSSPRIPGAFETNANSFVMMSDFSKIISELKPYLTGKSYKQLGIIHFASAFGAEITKTLKEINGGLNKPEVVEETYNQIGGNDFRTAILKLKTAGVDVLFLDMAGPDPLTFVRQAKQLGYAPTLIADTAVKDSLAAAGADQSLFNGVVVLNWDVTTDTFAAKFRALHGRDPGNSVNRAYDAVYILVNAVLATETSQEIPAFLEKTQFNTPNGDFRFSPEHAALNTPVAIEVIQDGKFTPLAN